MFCRSTIKFVLFFILLGAANSLKCQECSENDYHTDCRAGTITEATECSPNDDSCYLELLYGPENSYIPEYKRGCTTSDFCEEEEEEHDTDVKACYTCQDDMCNSDPMEDDVGTFDPGPLTCQKCSDSNYNSDCRLGKIEERSDCQKDENSCYIEYLIKNNKPHYIRDCANTDWCEKEKGNHGSDLKSCKTCSGHMCNKDVIGASDKSLIECFTCDANEYGKNCTTGNNLEKITCNGQGRGCYEYFFYNYVDPDQYRRGCEFTDFCERMEAKYPHFVKHCKVCNLDLCNNNFIEDTYRLSIG